MGNIIEKLGVPEIPCYYEDRGYSVCNEKPVRKLEQQNRDMLEALIEYYNVIEDEGIESRVDYSIIKNITGLS